MDKELSKKRAAAGRKGGKARVSKGAASPEDRLRISMLGVAARKRKKQQ